ncbi:MAG: hypothetical protein ACYDHB_12385 [Candidatus Dormibacteria bacterium]
MTKLSAGPYDGTGHAPPEPASPKPGHHAGWGTRSVVTVGAVALAVSGGLLGGASSVLAASSAPPHGTTTCAIAGDECHTAIAYANSHDGGGAQVLAVEADTEAHGGTVRHRAFDIRIQTQDGVYVVHVYRRESAPQGDGVWWQSRAENQNPSRGGAGSTPPSNSGGSSADTSPDTSNGPDASSPDSSPDHSAGQGGSASGGAKISAGQAASDAISFATGRGFQVLGVKHNQLKSRGQKDYYQVKLQLGQNGRKHGTTNVWVDATSSPGTVTAASGGGLRYRDSAIVSAATARADAVTAAGGGSAYKTRIHGGKWRWYWVFVRNGSIKFKIGVDAATGVVTQVRSS